MSYLAQNVSSAELAKPGLDPLNKSLRTESGGNVFLSFFLFIHWNTYEILPLTNIGYLEVQTAWERQKGYIPVFRRMSWFEYYRFTDLNMFYFSTYCRYYP